MSAVPIEIQGEQIASGLTPAGNIVGDDEQDTVLLRNMSGGATRYISSFPGSPIANRPLMYLEPTFAE